LDIALGGYSNDIVETGWVTLGGYSNVSITAEVGTGGVPSPSISAYLTTTTGAAETDADQIASVNIIPSSLDEVDTLFSGLDLGPGTYYLVLTGDGSAAWTTFGPVATTDPGLICCGNGAASIYVGDLNNINPPASTFVALGATPLFTVTGDPASVPEPGSFGMILIAGGLWFLKRRYSDSK